MESLRWILFKLCSLALTCLLAALFAVALIRWAPGFGVDELALDPRWSQQSRSAQNAITEQGLLAHYWQYLKDAVRGDLGVSTLLGAPVSELLAERIPVTARLAAEGLLTSWGLAVAAALLLTRWPAPSIDVSAALFSGVLLCLPAALIALGAVLAGAPARIALAAIVFPKLFRYSRGVLRHLEGAPHVLAARTRGVSEGRIVLVHVLLSALPQLFALGGISVSMALGAAVPVEAFCDLPGIGQLVWKAALGRDLPVLVNLTAFVALVTVCANAMADFGARLSERSVV